jgi:L-malate glycosyltransferase
MVLLEAMAAGTPVVGGSDSGAVPWVVGDAGLVTDVRKPELLAATIIELLENPGHACRIGALGRRSALSRFSLPSVVDAYLLHLDALASDQMPLCLAEDATTDWGTTCGR